MEMGAISLVWRGVHQCHVGRRSGGGGGGGTGGGGAEGAAAWAAWAAAARELGLGAGLGPARARPRAGGVRPLRRRAASWIMRRIRLPATQIVSAACGDWRAYLPLRMRTGRSALYHSSAALL